MKIEVEVVRVDMRYEANDTSGGIFARPVVTLRLRDLENPGRQLQEVALFESVEITEDGFWRATT